MTTANKDININNKETIKNKELINQMKTFTNEIPKETKIKESILSLTFRNHIN